ncbi:hypothetical protein EJ02DRAFT_430117 [Clathrospora elynae]|uniref:Uncharacterized protein n=1 Tax=Clathrospora elynae TaxID=706981 RepID=A0A6A5T978_9PLEO|nr:hypothetical protein EJ02DRAFT_430117 [Clathrospora elynae]
MDKTDMRDTQLTASSTPDADVPNVQTPEAPPKHRHLFLDCRRVVGASSYNEENGTIHIDREARKITFHIGGSVTQIIKPNSECKFFTPDVSMGWRGPIKKQMVIEVYLGGNVMWSATARGYKWQPRGAGTSDGWNPEPADFVDFIKTMEACLRSVVVEEEGLN